MAQPNDHLNAGRPLAGQGIVTEIRTPAPASETPHQHLRRLVHQPATPHVDHLDPEPGDGLTPYFRDIPDGKDALPDDLVQIDVDRGRRFVGSGSDTDLAHGTDR